MKKKFWILLALLMLCLAAVSAAGCSKKQSGDSTVLLSGFESVDELLSMNWQNMFGAADVVEDDDYVTQGEHAAKLSVRGDYSAGTAARPSMTIYTDSEWLQKTDYSDTTKMTVDVYNAQDETVNMYFQFGVLNEQNTYQYSSETKIELQPGANSVEIPFDRAFLDQLIDIKNIMRLLFMFDNETVKNQPARVLYMDNFVAHTTTEPIPTDVKIRQENEIESADRAEYISSWSIINYIYSPSELAHNTDPQFITQGTGSFKFSAPATGGGTTSPGIKLSEPAISDISSYYSISFDIYNDNDKDFAFHTLTFKTFGVAKAKSWTRFEFTIDQLENSFVDETLLNMQGYDPSRKEHYYDVKDFKNFTLMTTNDSADAPITFYIDNFFANPKDLSKPIINVNGEYAEEVNLNEQYTVPSDVTVSKGTLDKWVILGPDGTQIGEDNAASFTPAERGTYTIVYTATNENGTSEFKIEVYAGLPPTILLDTPNITILPGQYTVPVPEVDNNGTLSWKVYRITDSVRTQIGENSAPSFNAEGGFYQVEYTAVNDEAERTAYHNVLVIAPTTYTSIVSAYPDLYSADKLTASVGSASITSNKNYTLGDGNAIRMSGSGNVTVEYAFGADVGTAQTFSFAIYNPTASDLTFTFGMATTYNLAAHGWLRFDLPVSWYTEWKCINAETNILEKVNFSVSGSGEIEAYLTFFTLSPVQAGPAITVAAYEDHMPELSAYTVPAATASGGAAVMHEVFKRSGNDWALFASNSPAAFTPDAEGEYKIVYTAENVYGTSTREITVLFGAVPEIQLDFTDKRINEGTYTVEMPDVENAESVSWIVYQIASNLLYGDGQRVQQGGASPASFTAFAGLTYEIVYTSSNDVATVTAVQRLAVEGGIRLEEKYPDAFAAGNIHAAAGDVTAAGGWLTDKTLVGTGSKTVDFTFEPDIYLSAGLTAMPFWVMNGSDGEVKLTIAGSKAWSTEYVLQPGIWYRVDLPLESHLRIWGVVSADNYLQELGLKFTGTGDLTVYIDLFSVHMSGEAVAFNVPSDIVTEIDVGEPYTVPTVTAKDDSAVTYVITDKDGDPVNSSWLEGGVFTPEMGGTYTITYSAANVFGSSTYEIVLQCGEVPEIVLDFTDKNIAAGTYTVTPPVVADADISWVVYQINTNMLYGDGLRVQLGGDSPASFTALAGHMYEIVYTAVNDSGKVTAAQRLTVETGASLAELYPEAITADNITAESCEVSLETGYLTDKAIVAKGSNSFSVIFGADIYLSAGLNNFTVWVLNESAESITLIVNGKSASYTLVPGLWYRVDLSLTPYLRDWGIVDADNFLKSLGFSFTGTGEISVCIDRMSIGRSGEAVAFNVPSDIVTEIGVGEPYTVPTITAKDGSQVSWKVLAPDETQVGEDNAAEFTPMQGGKYSIVYSAANVFGTSEYRLEITVTASTPVLTEIDGHVHVNTGAAGAASYTIIPPTAEDGSQVTWKVYQCNNDLQWGDGSYTLLKDNSPASFDVVAAVSYKIEYSATNADGTTTLVQYVTGEGGIRLEEKMPAGFVTENLAAEAGTTADIAADGCLTEKTIKATGTAKVSFMFKPNVYLGGEPTALVFWVYNASESDIKATLGKDIERTLKAGVWYRISYPIQYYREWQSLDSSNNLTEIGFLFTGTGEIEVYVDLFTLYQAEGGAVGLEIPGDIVTEINVNEPYTIPTVTAKDGSEVTCTVTDEGGSPVNAAWVEDGVFTPQAGGTYVIVYSATNVFGTSTYKITLTASAPNAPVIALEDIHLKVQSGDYTVTVPVVDGATVTYVFEGREGTYSASQEYTAIAANDGANTYTLNPAWTYRITYTAQNASGTATAVQYLVCENGPAVEAMAPEKFVQESLVTEQGTDSVASITDNGVTDYTVEVSGTTAKVHFRPNIGLEVQGTLTNLVYWVFLESEADTVSLAFGGAGAGYGGPQPLASGRWYRFDLPLEWLQGSYGCLDGNTLVEIQVNATANGSPVTLYLDAITAYSA